MRYSMNLLVSVCLISLCAIAALPAQDVVFRSTFDYAGTPPDIAGDAALLNGSVDQVGLFSGSLPGGTGGSSPNLIGFVGTLDIPSDPMILIDRPLESGSFFADFSSPIAVDGATISFDVGLRRSSGASHVKDYDIIGRDAAGIESFHLRMSAFSGDDPAEDGERVGFVSDAGATVTFDLPTVVGADADTDLEQMGQPDYEPGLWGEVALNLGSDGFSVDFSRNHFAYSNAYTTDTLGYNGSATSITQLEFTFIGDADENSLRSGHVLDDIVVMGTPVVVNSLRCDADADSDCILDDLDAMYAVAGSAGGPFDYDSNGNVDEGDIQGWLDEASTSANVANTTGAIYVVGDVDLNGDVDSTDLGLLLNNFPATAATAGAGVGWGGGDLDINGTVDSTDLGLLLNQFGHMSTAPASVPEPDARLLLCLANVAFFALRRNAHPMVG